MKGFKKCPNGHWYKEELTTCPYCPGGSASAGNESTPMSGGGNNNKTEAFDNNMLNMTQAGGNKTTIVSEPAPAHKSPIYSTPFSNPANRTVFGDEIEDGKGAGEIEYRASRRLVGWLVTYSLDPLGVDFKIYEGKNLIGRDINSNITINDKMVSGKHATLLFRADKYRIKDELSSHGTFVNGEDIDDENFELQDGDIIKIGETVLKFKSSL